MEPRATSLGSVFRVPPHRDGVAPHRGQPDSRLLHAAPWPGRPAGPAQHAGGCWEGPLSWPAGLLHPLSLPLPGRRVLSRTTTTTGRGVPRTMRRTSGSRWTPGGPPGSQASSLRAATPASSTWLTGTRGRGSPRPTSVPLQTLLWAPGASAPSLAMQRAREPLLMPGSTTHPCQLLSAWAQERGISHLTA